MEPLIRTIADTALWVAVYRADESERTDAVFHDPYARMLAGERGEQIVRAMIEGRKNSWSFVSRTYLFDEFIMKQVKSGTDMVINIACGLDARPYRLELPAYLNWVDIDLPQITDYMNEKMQDAKPKCNFQRIALDLSQRAARLDLFAELSKRGEKILVVAEGLIGYLDASETGALAYDLSHTRNFKKWLLDLMSPGILPLINNEMDGLLEEAKSPLIFAPPEGEDFFSLFGWKLLESKSKLKTALQLNRLSDEMKQYAKMPEPTGPKGDFPWSGVCLFENRFA